MEHAPTTHSLSRLPQNPRPIPAVLSSQEAGWQGVLIERRRVIAGVRDSGPNRRHYLALNLGKPLLLTQQRDGQSHQGLMFDDRMMVMPAGIPSRWIQEEEADVMPVYIEPDFLQQTAVAVGAPQGRIELANRFEVDDPQVSRICRTMLAELESSCPNGRLFGESLATALAVHLLNNYTARAGQVPDCRGGLSSADLRRVLDFVQAHLSADLSLAEISASVHLSPYHSRASSSSPQDNPPTAT